jgi:hypothetical protein
MSHQAYALIDDTCDEVKGVAKSSEPGVFVDIYQPQNNMVIWQRDLSSAFLLQLQEYLDNGGTLNVSRQIGAHSISEDIAFLGGSEKFAQQLRVYVAELIDMFCCLFDANTLGLRISTLDRAMCPRFHVDYVPCRLVTTFSGSGSQWLPDDKVNRGALGSQGGVTRDDDSPLFASPDDIQNLQTGDVAIMKGERWQGNEDGGVIHRSPPVSNGTKRIVMTLDLID